MTLVVYKNGILATDSRRTHVCSRSHTNKCAYCEKPAVSVKDDADKLFVVRKKGSIKFRNVTILAYACAGDVEMINRIKGVLRLHDDLEAVYKSYLAIHGTHTKNERTCTVMLIGVEHNFIVRIPEQGSLDVKVFEKDKFLAIGSGTQGARWINKLMPEAWAPLIINMVMEDDVGVGGTISYVDLNEEIEEGSLRPVMLHVPNDPKTMIERANKVFSMGEAVEAENEVVKVRKEAGYPEVWDLPISDLGLKVHTLNNLMTEGGITHVAELIMFTPQTLLKIPKIGKVALQEVHARLKDRKLTLGTDTNSWPNHKKAK
jgi:hypothetical protein